MSTKNSIRETLLSVSNLNDTKLVILKNKLSKYFTNEFIKSYFEKNINENFILKYINQFDDEKMIKQFQIVESADESKKRELIQNVENELKTIFDNKPNIITELMKFIKVHNNKIIYSTPEPKKSIYKIISNANNGIKITDYKDKANVTNFGDADGNTNISRLKAVFNNDKYTKDNIIKISNNYNNNNENFGYLFPSGGGLKCGKLFSASISNIINNDPSSGNEKISNDTYNAIEKSYKEIYCQYVAYMEDVQNKVKQVLKLIKYTMANNPDGPFVPDNYFGDNASMVNRKTVDNRSDNINIFLQYTINGADFIDNVGYFIAKSGSNKLSGVNLNASYKNPTEIFNNNFYANNVKKLVSILAGDINEENKESSFDSKLKSIPSKINYVVKSQIQEDIADTFGLSLSELNRTINDGVYNFITDIIKSLESDQVLDNTYNELHNAVLNDNKFNENLNNQIFDQIKKYYAFDAYIDTIVSKQEQLPITFKYDEIKYIINNKPNVSEVLKNYFENFCIGIFNSRFASIENELTNDIFKNIINYSKPKIGYIIQSLLKENFKDVLVYIKNDKINSNNLKKIFEESLDIAYSQFLSGDNADTLETAKRNYINMFNYYNRNNENIDYDKLNNEISTYVENNLNIENYSVLGFSNTKITDLNDITVDNNQKSTVENKKINLLKAIMVHYLLCDSLGDASFSEIFKFARIIPYGGSNIHANAGTAGIDYVKRHKKNADELKKLEKQQMNDDFNIHNHIIGIKQKNKLKLLSKFL